MNKELSIQAIVVTHNNESTITNCLQSLQKHGVTTISVVDNASQDATVMHAKKNGATVIEMATNAGFATAVNAGVDTNNAYPYLLLLNPDAILQDTLQPARTLLEQNAKVGIIGLGLYDDTGKQEQHAFGDEPTLLNLYTRKLIPPKNPGTGYKNVDWVSGGAMLLRRSTWEALKGFDGDFFLYWEDVDFCHRTRAHGWKVIHMPSIHVWHARGASLGDKKTKTKIYDTSADRYFQKHYSTPIWILQRILRHIYRWFSPRAR